MVVPKKLTIDILFTIEQLTIAKFNSFYISFLFPCHSDKNGPNAVQVLNFQTQGLVVGLEMKYFNINMNLNVSSTKFQLI